jgi:hypothetical protein
MIKFGERKLNRTDSPVADSCIREKKNQTIVTLRVSTSL